MVETRVQYSVIKLIPPSVQFQSIPINNYYKIIFHKEALNVEKYYYISQLKLYTYMGQTV